MQDTWGLLQPDVSADKTVVAVGIARMGEPAIIAQYRGTSSYRGTGMALSAAAGRLSYIHGLKVSTMRLCLSPW